MRLVRATFDKYDRFYLNPNLKSFSVEPVKGVICVAGDNGSGKSSLCRAMMPWPLYKGSIEDTGSVIREWEHEGVSYQDSYIDGRYSFLREGQELNPGYGLRVQEGLFTEYFGTDLAAIKVLSGVDTFTGMSPKLRQYWMSRLDSFQLEKLEEVVKRLKENKKEAEVLLKYHHGQMGRYTLTDSIDSLHTQREQVADRLDTLLSIRFSRVGSINISALTKAYKASVIELRNCNIYIRKVPTTVATASEAEVTSYLRELQLTRKVYVDKLMELAGSEISIEGLPSAAECDLKITRLQQALHPNVSTRVSPSMYDRYLRVSSNILTYQQQLSATMYTSGHQALASSTVNNLRYRVTQLTAEITKTEMHISQIKEGLSHPLECPECRHTFGIHGDKRALANNETQLHNLRNQLSVTTQQLEDAQQQLESITDHLTAMVQLRILLDDISIGFSDVVTQAPSAAAISRGISELLADLEHSYENAKLQAEIEKYREFLTIHTMFQDQHTNKTTAGRLEYEQKLTEVDVNIAATERLLSQLKQYTQYVNRATEAQSKLAEIGKQMQVQLQGMLDVGMDKAVTESILSLRRQLSNIETSITSYEDTLVKHREVTEAIQATEAKLSTFSECLTVLDGKVGFIGHLYKERVFTYIDRMNLIIQELWGYQMRIHVPPDTMNFRFPLELEGMMREDISHGSKGMQEAINIAFILLVRAQCNLSHIPFILDEFGSALDATHLDKAYQYFSQYSVEQLWLVSHLTDITQLFDDSIADYIALTTRHIPTNLLPPSTNDILTWNK